MAFRSTSSLSVSLGQTGNPFVVYATQPAGNVMAMRYRLEPSYDSSWKVWLCFDLVRQPQRTAATNLSDLTPEAYATTTDGKLFVRHFYFDPYGWAPWESLPLPDPSSRATDVAAVGLPSPILFVYVIDRDRVFTRRRGSSNPLSAYQPWREISAPPSVRRISAGMRPDGRQQLFVTDAAGAMFTAIQSNAAPDASFGSFQRFGDDTTPTFTEVHCAYLKDHSVSVFALSNGGVWSRRPSGEEWTAWTPEGGTNKPTLATFTVGSLTDQSPTIFGTDFYGASSGPRLWQHIAGSDVWSEVN